MTEESRRAMIELARRESGGTQVALLWSREDARLTVSVVGAGDGASFELDAARGSALDVFYHPYAYAARGHRKDDDD